MNRVFVQNLVLICIAGVLVTAGLLYYTDLLPGVADLLALGGGLVWVAVVLRVLVKTRIEELQKAIDDKVLSQPRTRIYSIAFVAATIIFGSFFGTVELQQLSDAERLVWTDWKGDVSAQPMLLSAGSVRRENFLTTFWNPRVVKVKANGLPAKHVRVDPWSKTKLHVPGSFMTQVLLVRPSERMMSVIVNNPRKLFISVDGGKPEEVDFDGHTIWVGCDRTVDIPERLQQSWRSAPKAYLDRWMSPKPLEKLRLKPYGKVKMHSEKPKQDFPEVEVKPYQRLADFPQEVVLDVSEE